MGDLVTVLSKCCCCCSRLKKAPPFETMEKTLNQVASEGKIHWPLRCSWKWRR